MTGMDVQQSQPAAATPTPGTGQVIGGIVFIVVWALVHVVLFYLFFASGVLVDIMLKIVRSIMFPGESRTLTGDEVFGWTGILQTGLILAGAAGVPRGLAIFWRSRRKLLLRCFWIAFFAGVFCELYAVYMLLAAAFSARP
ncbi:MAG: hypothetical protein U0984_18880 [Prosthecobacter sp.]|nr:hypothetical protein [Prosthecobacter sp.]